MRSFDFAPYYRSTVGFDRLFSNLTRASRYRHFEPDPSASSPLCPLAGTIGSQTLSSFISLLLAGRAMMPARRLSLSR